MTMYNPAHPGEILREYLAGVPVEEAAQAVAARLETGNP